ncbi:MAG: hypothetical protein DRP29_05270 [Thermodesulfobacteriota bacterium]|nr:MAG: hypothetical protein DRP29_05270 [Thermodesulfobacteriota bacterium]
MICPRCGTQINQGNTCPSCGYVVTSKGTTGAPKSTGSSSTPTPTPKLIMLNIVCTVDSTYPDTFQQQIPISLFPQSFPKFIDTIIKRYNGTGYDCQIKELINSLGGTDGIIDTITNLDYSVVQEGDVLIESEHLDVHLKIEVEKKA